MSKYNLNKYMTSPTEYLCLKIELKPLLRHINCLIYLSGITKCYLISFPT